MLTTGSTQHIPLDAPHKDTGVQGQPPCESRKDKVLSCCEVTHTRVTRPTRPTPHELQHYLCALVLHLMGSRIEQSGDLVSPKGCLSHKQINIHGITSETCTWLFEWMVGAPASRSSNEGVITVPNSCFLFQFVQKTQLELHGVLVLPFSQYNLHLFIHRCPLSQSVQQSLCFGCLGHLFT